MSPFINPVTGEIILPIGPAVGGGGGGGGLTSARRTTRRTDVDFVVPTLSTVDYMLNVETDDSAVQITLPDAIASDGFLVFIKNLLGPNVVTVVAQFGQTIEGDSASILSGVGDSYSFGAVDGNWFIY